MPSQNNPFFYRLDSLLGKHGDTDSHIDAILRHEKRNKHPEIESRPSIAEFITKEALANTQYAGRYAQATPSIDAVGTFLGLPNTAFVTRPASNAIIGEHKSPYTKENLHHIGYVPPIDDSSLATPKGEATKAYISECSKLLQESRELSMKATMDKYVAPTLDPAKWIQELKTIVSTRHRPAIDPVGCFLGLKMSTRSLSRADIDPQHFGSPIHDSFGLRNHPSFHIPHFFGYRGSMAGAVLRDILTVSIRRHCTKSDAYLSSLSFPNENLFVLQLVAKYSHHFSNIGRKLAGIPTGALDKDPLGLRKHETVWLYS